MSEFKCFVMMPFGNDSDKILKIIKKAASMIRENTVIIHRADLGKPLDTKVLEEHIVNHIDQADFGIAEISDHNPNVMLEVGLTIAQDKPVILMVRHGCGAPVDLRGRYWFEYDHGDLSAISDRLAEFIYSAIEQVQAGEVRSNYLVKAYSNRTTAPILQSITRASKRILINTTNLEWLIMSDALNAILKRLAQREKLEVRILVLEPESEFAADRARQLALDVRQFRDQLRKSLDHVAKALTRFSNRCKIATYSEIPTQIVMIMDNVVFYGVASANRRARENVVICLPFRHSGVTQSFFDHFVNIWRKSELFGGGSPGLVP